MIRHKNSLAPFLLAICIALAACTKITQENFNRVQDGMTEAEVQAILGAPTTSSKVDVLGVSGTASRWTSSDAEITIRFLNGKVALKSFDKSGVKK